jgi:predicted nucleic acid-binding protein
MSALLLDTGPLVACLDRSDPYHDWVKQRFSSIQGRVFTKEEIWPGANTATLFKFRGRVPSSVENTHNFQWFSLR